MALSVSPSSTLSVVPPVSVVLPVANSAPAQAQRVSTTFLASPAASVSIAPASSVSIAPAQTAAEGSLVQSYPQLPLYDARATTASGVVPSYPDMASPTDIDLSPPNSAQMLLPDQTTPRGSLGVNMAQQGVAMKQQLQQRQHKKESKRKEKEGRKKSKCSQCC